MSLEFHLPPYAEYDTTLPIVVPPDFSRKRAIESVKCSYPCFLDRFPEVNLVPGSREIHLIYFFESMSLGKILQLLGSETTLEPEPLDTGFILASQHPGYKIQAGIGFLGSLWSLGKSINTTYFPYLSKSVGGRLMIRLKSDQRKLHPGWRIAVGSSSER